MKRPRDAGMSCPHCNAQAIARSSSQISDLVREVRYICSDLEECGHIWLAHLSVVHSVRPSARPNPKVRIPLSAAFRGVLAPA